MLHKKEGRNEEEEKAYQKAVQEIKDRYPDNEMAREINLRALTSNYQD